MMDNKRRIGSAEKIKLGSFDDLFVLEENAEHIEEVPLTQLHPFKNHPFQVNDDDEMNKLADSIRTKGVLVPGIVRPRLGGGYELISGHRRKRGSELAGKETMPVIVKDYSDDEAVMVMVDANIQRESLLPSEKARAYRMCYEAQKHQGKHGGNTLDAMGNDVGESGKTVQRYIWLSRLSDRLLEMVDKKELGLVQGVNLSFLTSQQQDWIYDAISSGVKINVVQSSKLKECSLSGQLDTPQKVRAILSGLAGKKKTRKITLQKKRLDQYFDDTYTNEEIEKIICNLLEQWSKEVDSSAIKV